MSAEEHTEEVVDEGAEEVIEEENEDPVESRARSMGWKPWEEWDGDPQQWVGPEAFIVKGDLLQEIRKKNKTIGELQNSVKELSDHNKRLAQTEYDKALKELRKQRVEAEKDDDADKVVELDEKIEEFSTKKKQIDSELEEEKDTSKENEQNPEFQEWVAQPENQWYQNNPRLRGYADGVAIEFVQENPNATFQQVVNHVEREMAKEYPNYKQGSTERKRNTGDVTEPSQRSPGGRSKKGKKYGVKDLDDETRRMAKKFVQQGAFKTEQEYVDQLAEIGYFEER